MSLIITEECINCKACAAVCPENAIYEPAKKWKYNGKYYKPLSQEHFFIVEELCDNCKNFKTKKCVEICPMDAIKEV